MTGAKRLLPISVEAYLAQELFSPVKQEYLGGAIYRRPTERFYYPDASVIGRSNPANEYFQDEPVVVAEVLSNSTRRLDEGEKKDAYLTIPSLAVYLLVEQATARIVVYRRADRSFVAEVYEGLDAIVRLSEIETELPLADVFDGVSFHPEPVEDNLR